MSFPRYPAYKPSGVEWLGEVPEHWSVNRFKLSVDSCTNGVWGDEASNDENDVICIRVADFDRHRLEARKPDEPTIRNVSDRDIEQRSLYNGDLLIEKSGGGEKQPVGAVVLYIGTAPAVCSNFVARMRLKRGLSPSFWRYAHHAAYSVRLNTKSIKQTSGIQNLDQQQYLDESAAYPPLEEQLAIASFLDRETAKIDALIAEQQRLIELLQEKRQAVISHAVTKGLNPNAPMKDSGVEWLGEVPEHWSLAAVGHRYSVQLGKMLDAGQQTGNHKKPYLRVADVQWGSINIEELPEMDFPPETQPRYRLKAGDLLVNEGGSYVGRSAIWSAHIEECYYQKALHRLRAYDPTKDSPYYMYWLMEHATRLGVFVAGGNQTTIDHLTAEQLRRYRFGFPSLDEQEEIAKYLSLKAGNLQQLTTEAENLVAVLLERRSALISAAVTGQIDVRGLATEEEP